MINTISDSKKSKKNIINITLILITLSIITIAPLKYAFHVDLQRADSIFEKITAFSAMVVNNWLMDGIAHDKFVMHGDFPSIEFEKNQNRSLYLSYPPGALIPLYLAAKITGKEEISIGFVKRFVQYEYYLSILFLGLLFYTCMMVLKIRFRPLLIIIPIVLSSLWAFLPFNFFYMRNVYFTDEAVMLLFIIFLIIEILLYSKQFEKYTIPLHIIYAVVLLSGLLTDYLFFSVVFVTFCVHFINSFQDRPEKTILYNMFSETWVLIVSTIIAVSLFIIQLLSIPYGLTWLAVTFQIRTDWSADKIETLMHHFGNGFTFFFMPILIFVSVFCVIFYFIRKHYSKKNQLIIHWLSIIVLSSVLHTVILQAHSALHEFSMMKYNLVFTFIIFSCLCWICLSNRDYLGKAIKKYPAIILASIVLLIILCFSSLIIYDKKFYYARTCDSQDIYDGLICRANIPASKFIRDNTNYYDVIFSPDYEINYDILFTNDLVVSKKRIYKALDLEDIPLKDLPDNAVINILISKQTLKNKSWGKLDVKKTVCKNSNDFYLCKFSKKSFQTLMHSR